jgi:hypothetical protein
MCRTRHLILRASTSVAAIQVSPRNGDSAADSDKSGASLCCIGRHHLVHHQLTVIAANLREYIKDPQARVKGNHMPFGGLSNLEDIDDIIAYRKALSPI